MTASTISVTVHDETDRGFNDAARLATIATETLSAEGVPTGSLDLILVEVEPMAALNHDHMGHDGPTDVLAFPLDGPEPDRADLDGVRCAEADPDLNSGVPTHLGDVVVCPAVAEKQAPSHCGDLDAELTLLVVHGVLHVLGHDHTDADEADAMRARERHHLARYGLAHPGAE